MTRNRYFDEWSAPAQPAGFPDVVTWVKVTDLRAAADAVREGRADLAELTPLGPKDLAVASALVEEMRRTHPDRLDRGFPQATNFGVVNSSVLPFSKLKARRAFNFAVDRDKVVALLGGPDLGVATCQLMPPTMPSYQPYCPYTTGPPDGDYEGPDLARARELVRRSGTRGMEVLVTDLVGDYNPQLDDYFAHVLRRIGYDASVDRLPDTPHNEHRLYSGHSGFQVVSGGFIADFPQPSNFYQLVSCGRWEGNYPLGHCNRTMDARAAAATVKLQTDPAGALRDWTEIERDLTNQAPLVAVSNFIDWWMSSERVGNYQTGAEGLGPLMSQLWVR
jgi:peptide/nickel transport system substrate-binding protein